MRLIHVNSDNPTVELDGARAFEDFFQKSHRRVLGLAFVLSGRIEVAEELTQEAYAAAFKRWDELTVMSDAEAWVRRVVANKAASHVRRVVAETRALARHGPDPADTLDHQPGEHAWVWSLVRRLPKRQAQVIALRFYAGLSVAEIASQLNCSQDTVNTHIRRARRSLAAQIDRKDTR